MSQSRDEMPSLLSGRNSRPLDDDEKRRVSSQFLGFDIQINARYVGQSHTRFCVTIDAKSGESYGEILFSDDIYPGRNNASPNSVLSMSAALAHELAHYHRWVDKRELEYGELQEIDEAMTSLEAALMFERKLLSTDIMGLISDALERLRLFANNQKSTDN